MNKGRTQDSLLLDYHLSLKSELRNWLASTGTKHAVLAAMLELDVSAVSHAIRPQGSISENFIRRLSAVVPEFASAYPRFYQLKYGAEISGEQKGDVDRAAVRAQRVMRLRAAEEEVISAVRAMTQAAIDLATRD